MLTLSSGPLEIEAAVRTVLAGIPEGATLTTTELVGRLAPSLVETELRMTLFRRIPKLPATLYHLELGEGLNYHKGMPVNRKRWHHLATAAIPERPLASSSGAASGGLSLLALYDDLARRVAALESALTPEGV